MSSVERASHIDRYKDTQTQKKKGKMIDTDKIAVTMLKVC